MKNDHVKLKDTKYSVCSNIKMQRISVWYDQGG